MAIHHEKMTRKPKKVKAKSVPPHFEDVARKPFTVPKSVVTPDKKKD